MDALARRFEAVVFDWDGTAVADRAADASAVRDRVERLCAAAVDVAVVSGTHVGNVDGQLRARPHGPGRLFLCLNRGSEVFEATAGGIDVLFRRDATPAEDAALTAAATLAVDRLGARGLQTAVVSTRLNRRKIDLIPEPPWRDPPKAEIDRLLAAVEKRLAAAGIGGLPEVVALARTAAAEAGLPGARVTSDAKHVEIGLTDKADSARWILADLWSRGVGPGLTLFVGDELGPLGGLRGSDSLMLVPEAARATVVSVGVEPTGVPRGVLAVGGGPDRFLRLLDDQLRRRERMDVPEIDSDPAWSLTVAGSSEERERVSETLLTLADGRFGTSASPADATRATPWVFAAGLYGGEGPDTELVPCPVWNSLPIEVAPGSGLRRVLDLRTGCLSWSVDAPGAEERVLLFASLARPGTMAMRAVSSAPLTGAPSHLDPPPRAPDTLEVGRVGSAAWMRLPVERDGGAAGGVVAAASTRVLEDGPGVRADRIAAFAAHPDVVPSLAATHACLREAEDVGFDRLLAEHRACWASRWEDADVGIGGDPDLQRAVRFALFHLMASVADTGEAAVGARGLTGPAYRGHVFWDSDVFVLPFLAATHPRGARAMLEYRLRRLPAARAAARARGARGARFPWESAARGTDVTPLGARNRDGRLVPIRTGLAEEHVVADVAWAADCYVAWSGDSAFVRGPGLPLFVETARYWASRVRRDRWGAAHVYDVIGPDEYHEPVDDNAYTNVMARWNLRRAAEAVREAGGGAPVDEVRLWLEIAGALVDGFDPATGLYEQFAGFGDLDPLVIAEVAPRRPIAADLLLGPEVVHAAQVVKQADVLMLHHLVPDEVDGGSLGPNLDFYEPRTAHGSSLSPGVHASLFARAGRLEEAVAWLRVAALVDLDDVTGSTAGGLHLATMGSVWQCLAWGFAGLRPRGGVLHLDPVLPPGWDHLEIRLSFQGARVRVLVGRDTTTVRASRPVAVRMAGTDGAVAAGRDGVELTNRKRR